MDEELRAQLKEFLAATSKQEPNEKPTKPHPYYTQSYADAARKIVDQIIATKHGYIMKLFGGNAITAKIQWYQGCRYLKENSDSTGAYAQALKRIGCRAEPDQLSFYLKATFKPDIRELQPTEATPWRDDFLLWLDKPDKQMHEKFPTPQGVTLSEEDINWGNQQMIGLETIYLWKFEEHSITVIRYDSNTNNS